MKNKKTKTAQRFVFNGIESLSPFGITSAASHPYTKIQKALAA
jgi:hypothetical protein